MRWIAMLVLAAMPVFGQYVYYSTTFNWPINMYGYPDIPPEEWAPEDQYAQYAFQTRAGYLTNANIYSQGYLKSTVTPPSSTGEVKTTLRLQVSGGTISHYLEMRDGAWVPDSWGNSSSYVVCPTWLRVNLQNITVNGANCSGTLVIDQAIAGTLTTLASTAVGCHGEDGAVRRGADGRRRSGGPVPSSAQPGD